MRKLLLLIVSTGMIVSLSGYDGKYVNGKAVSVQWRHGWKDWAGMCCECFAEDRNGSILLYTIQNSQVTHCDTIYERELGLAQYPAFNLSGSRIAFFRDGRAPAATGNGCVTVNDGKTFISTINSDGTGLTDLCEIPSLGNGNFVLDWPGSDWVYFEMPHDDAHSFSGSSESLMLWRVNAVTGAMEKVCNFTEDGSGTELMCGNIVRWSLTVNADRMAMMVYPKYGCDVDVGMDHVNHITQFPPPDCNVREGVLDGRAGCNISVSPSGAQVGSYFAGWHDDLHLTGTNFWINDMEEWAGEEIGNGAECIRWSANSDKWVGQCIGFVATGHAGSQSAGSNQVIANWIDKVAINVSKNPRTDPGDINGQGVMRWNNCTGDFFVEDPQNNPGGNKYEDLQGAWHVVEGATPVVHGQAPGSHGAEGSWFTLDNPGRQAFLSLPANAQWEISVTDLQGKVTLRRVSDGPTRLILDQCARGAYVVTARAHNQTRTRRVVLK